MAVVGGPQETVSSAFNNWNIVRAGAQHHGELPMFRLPLIGALLITMVSLAYPNVVCAFKSTFKLPCMLSYNGKPPISTHCVASIDASQRTVVEMSSTANGRRFVIENHKADVDEWYLDYERAVRISDEPITCYANREVKLCFDGRDHC